jgi:SPP1 family predicted phage head-tail adaptor
MGVGQMDRRIEIQVLTATRGASGGQKRTWAELATVWAEVDYKGGSEVYEAKEKTAINRVKFRIRYLATVTEENRISYDSNFYDITHIEVLGRNCYQILTAEKKTVWQEQ